MKRAATKSDTSTPNPDCTDFFSIKNEILASVLVPLKLESHLPFVTSGFRYQITVELVKENIHKAVSI